MYRSCSGSRTWRRRLARRASASSRWLVCVARSVAFFKFPRCPLAVACPEHRVRRGVQVFDRRRRQLLAVGLRCVLGAAGRPHDTGLGPTSWAFVWAPHAPVSSWVIGADHCQPGWSCNWHWTGVSPGGGGSGETQWIGVSPGGGGSGETQWIGVSPGGGAREKPSGPAFLREGGSREKPSGSAFLPEGGSREKPSGSVFLPEGGPGRNPVDRRFSRRGGGREKLVRSVALRPLAGPRRSRKVRGSAIRVGGGAKRRRRHYIAPSR